jgi:hypothetical protein
VVLDPDDTRPPFDLDTPLSKETAQALWRNSISVQNWTLVNHFSPQESTVPTPWRKHAVLRYTRPVIFVDGVYRFDHNGKSYQLRLSRELGLQLINLSAPKEDA